MGLSSTIFLGFTIHREGIDLDLAKVKAIQAMEPLTTCKQLQSFMGRVFYVGRFTSALTELIEPFHKLLNINAPIKWGEEHQNGFKELRTRSAHL